MAEDVPTPPAEVDDTDYLLDMMEMKPPTDRQPLLPLMCLTQIRRYPKSLTALYLKQCRGARRRHARSPFQALAKDGRRYP